MSNDLAVITVVYNNYEVTRDFIESLEDQTEKDFKLYICDFSVKKQTIKTTLKIKVIHKPNRGYGAGLNYGLSTAIEDGCQSLILINNDTIVKKDFISQAKKSLKKNPNSIIGGKIYYYPGFEYHKNRYKKDQRGKVIWYAGGEIDWDNVYTNHIGVDEVDRGQYDRKTKTDFITGCVMILDKSVIDKLGFFDEKYFMYFEDADYCQRAKQANVTLVYDPSLEIWHKNAQSTDGSGSAFHVKTQKKSRLRFGLKYAPLKTRLHLLKNLLLNQ